MNLKKSIISLLLTVVLVAQLACSGPLQKLQDTLTYAPPFISGLAAAGAFSRDLELKLLADTSEGRVKVLDAKVKLDAVTGTDSQKKLKRYIIYAQLANDWRVIVSRNHFAQANNPKIEMFVLLVNQILDIIVAQNAVTPAGARGGPAPSDEELNKKVQQLDTLLKGK